MSTKLIALCGLAGSGKSTAADYLVSRHHFRRIRFASPIKRMIRCMLVEAGAGPVEAMEMVDGNLKEVPSDLVGGKSPRFLMQSLGTEWGRQLVAQDIWRKILLKKISRCLSDGISVVVDDLRYENEAAALKQFGFSIISVKRDRITPIESHSSEEQVICFDRILMNNDSVAKLHDDLETFLSIIP